MVEAQNGLSIYRGDFFREEIYFNTKKSRGKTDLHSCYSGRWSSSMANSKFYNIGPLSLVEWSEEE